MTSSTVTTRGTKDRKSAPVCPGTSAVRTRGCASRKRSCVGIYPTCVGRKAPPKQLKSAVGFPTLYSNTVTRSWVVYREMENFFGGISGLNNYTVLFPQAFVLFPHAFILSTQCFQAFDSFLHLHFCHTIKVNIVVCRYFCL